jgi:hypothetical protein
MTAGLAIQARKERRRSLRRLSQSPERAYKAPCVKNQVIGVTRKFPVGRATLRACIGGPARRLGVLQDLGRTPTRMMRSLSARAARQRLGTARLQWALTGSGAVYDPSEPQLS